MTLSRLFSSVVLAAYNWMLKMKNIFKAMTRTRSGVIQVILMLPHPGHPTMILKQTVKTVPVSSATRRAGSNIKPPKELPLKTLKKPTLSIDKKEDLQSMLPCVPALDRAVI